MLGASSQTSVDHGRDLRRGGAGLTRLGLARRLRPSRCRGVSRVCARAGAVASAGSVVGVSSTVPVVDLAATVVAATVVAATVAVLTLEDLPAVLRLRLVGAREDVLGAVLRFLARHEVRLPQVPAACACTGLVRLVRNGVVGWTLRVAARRVPVGVVDRGSVLA